MHCAGRAGLSGVRLVRRSRLSRGGQRASQLPRTAPLIMLMKLQATGLHLWRSKGTLSLPAIASLNLQSPGNRRSCAWISAEARLVCLFRQDTPWRWVDSEDALRTYIVFFGILLAGELPLLKV